MAPPNPTYKEIFKKAQDSASTGDAFAMFQSLCDSLVYESYLSFFSRKYPEIDRNDIYDIIGISNEDLYLRVSRNEKILRVESYLWKVIDRKLSEFAVKRKLYTRHNIENIGAKDNSSSMEDVHDNIDTRRKRLFEIAEGLIPKLNIGSVQDVIRYIFGAIRNGAEDISDQEISDALNIPRTNVRQYRKRGFDRLARIAKEENLVKESCDFALLEETEYYIDESEDETSFDENEIIE